MINIEPCFFGVEKHLFGVYSPPIKLDNGQAVLIPHVPFFEQDRLTWLFTRVAKSLCDAGFHVFRFDLEACGNSYGNSEQLTLDTWQNNIISARDELLALSGSRRLKVVGTRFLAAVASHVCNITGDTLICFDPLFEGRSFIEQLTNMRSYIIENTHVDPQHLQECEYAGVVLSKTFVEEVKDYSAIADVISTATIVAEEDPALSCEKYLKTPTPFMWDILEPPMAYAHDAAGVLHEAVVQS